MRSKHKTLFIITALLTLVPLIVGLILWSRLPEQVPSGVDSEGNVTSYNSREFAVIWMPIIMLLAHFILTSVGSGRRKNENITDGLYKGICCASPLLCNAVCLPTFAVALGAHIPLNVIICALVGLMFIAVGFAIRTLKPNYSLGLRFPWALRDDDVWRFTHRFGGIVFICCGIAMFACGFYYSTAFAVIIFAAAVLIPIIVSAIYGSVTEKRKEREAAIKKAAAKAAKAAKNKPSKPSKKLN